MLLHSIVYLFVQTAKYWCNVQRAEQSHPYPPTYSTTVQQPSDNMVFCRELSHQLEKKVTAKGRPRLSPFFRFLFSSSSKMHFFLNTNFLIQEFLSEWTKERFNCFCLGLVSAEIIFLVLHCIFMIVQLKKRTF